MNKVHRKTLIAVFSHLTPSTLTGSPCEAAIFDLDAIAFDLKGAQTSLKQLAETIGIAVKEQP
jgi:hypothetical protein